MKSHTASPNLLCANKRIISDRTHNCKVKRQTNERTTIWWEAEKTNRKILRFTCAFAGAANALQRYGHRNLLPRACYLSFSLFFIESHSHGFYAPTSATELHVWNALAHVAGVVRRFDWIGVNQLQQNFHSNLSEIKIVFIRLNEEVLCHNYTIATSLPFSRPIHSVESIRFGTSSDDVLHRITWIHNNCRSCALTHQTYVLVHHVSYVFSMASNCHRARHVSLYVPLCVWVWIFASVSRCRFSFSSDSTIILMRMK